MKRPVVLTRPAGENEALAARLEADGFGVVFRPLIKLSELEVTSQARETVMNLDRYDRVIFVSKAAVKTGMTLFDRYWPAWPAAVTWLSVGVGTAELLKDWDIDARYPIQAGSEGLLALSALTDVGNLNVLIVRGRGGRELLAETLRARGAVVDYLETYGREPVKYNDWNIGQAPLIVLATSVEIMESLTQQAGVKPENIDLIAASTRIAEAATRYGFGSLTNAGGASEQALYDAVTSLQQLDQS